MAGRGGRGGGAGGGGRPSTSLTQEQLMSLGVIGKDMTNNITAPPPIYPPLVSKPVPLENNAARDYKILWKEDFISYLKDSSYFTHPSDSENKIQRYSDKYIRVIKTSKDKNAGEFLWERMPADLKPNWKRKKPSTSDGKSCLGGGAKKIKLVNVEEKLKALEEREINKNSSGNKSTSNGGVENNANGGGAAGANGKNAGGTDDEDEEAEIDEDEQDEEMDEDNDYGNSYFDNGDAYNEEDDNLDDGPVY